MTKKYNIKYYYTYKDLCELTNTSLTLAQIIKLGYSGENTNYNAIVQEIFERAIIKFENWYFILKDEELTFTAEEITNMSSDKLRELARRLKDWYYSTYTYYSTMLTYYNSIESTLMAPIETVVNSESSNNSYDDDTPQTKTVDGVDIFAKDHASFYNYGDNTNETTSKVDNLYNVQKLSELHKNMLDLKDEWATTLKDYIITAQF